jgi:DNA-binding transcriptional ArsR family regulator
LASLDRSASILVATTTPTTFDTHLFLIDDTRGNDIMSTVKTAPKASKPKASNAKGNEQRHAQAQRVATLLKHVSDQTRLQVVLILAEGERHVGALCAQLSQSQPAVSHHLALLRHGGIISPRRKGKNNFYSLTETGESLAKVAKILLP